jgi:RecA-family ATPase
MENKQINKQDIEKYLEYMNHKNPTEVIVFDDEKYPNGKATFSKDKKEIIKQIEKYNIDEEVNVYSGARDRTGKGDKNVTGSEFIWVEIDEHDKEKPEDCERFEKLMNKYNIEIGMKGFSGGGYHYYIPHKNYGFHDEQSKQVYKNTLNLFRDVLLDNNIDIDKGVFDLQRVTRVIGTFNHRWNKLSKIIYINKDIDKIQNFLNMSDMCKSYIKKPKEPKEKGEYVIEQDAFKILEKYGIDKRDKWIYEILKNKIEIQEDTGGNSVFGKNCAIALAQNEMLEEEMKVVGREFFKLILGRSLASFMGWIRKTQDGEMSTINKIEINRAIDEGGYSLSKYSNNEASEEIQEIVKVKEHKLKLLTIRDYEKHKISKDYIIKDVIYPSEINLAFGQSGHMKSFLALYKALCIASGRKYLGKFRTKKQPVAYMSAENHMDTDKERLFKLMRGLKIRSRKIPLYFIPRSMCKDVLEQKYFADLYFTLKEKGIKVLFLDTINPLTPSIDDNSARDVTGLFNNFLKPLVDNLGLTIIFLHHTDKKGSDFLGSTKWFANSDGVWRIERSELTNRVKIYNHKNRKGEQSVKEIQINFSDKEITFDLVDEGGIEKFSKKKKPSQKDFFMWKLKTIVKDTSLERLKIYQILKENECTIKTDKSGKNSTLDRAIAEWRKQE